MLGNTPPEQDLSAWEFHCYRKIGRIYGARETSFLKRGTVEKRSANINVSQTAPESFRDSELCNTYKICRVLAIPAINSIARTVYYQGGDLPVPYLTTG